MRLQERLRAESFARQTRRRKGGEKMQETFREYCLRTGNEQLLAQWIPEKNLPVQPDDVSGGSNRKVWWRCPQGHEWQARVKSRTMGYDCPVCSNRQAAPGVNTLGTLYPLLAEEWHPEKNGALTPEDVMAGTHRKVWWLCPEGHAWQARVSARTQGGAGCPYCAGKRVIPGKTDLQSQFPLVAAEWSGERNGALTPETVSAYSNRKVWWQCSRGHHWQAIIASRTISETGCPYCSGRKVLPGFNDLATTEPEVSAQWYAPLNGAVTPEMVTAGSHRKVWWICKEGHVWKAAIYSRTGQQKCGCPVCAGRTRKQRRSGGFAEVGKLSASAEQRLTD